MRRIDLLCKLLSPLAISLIALASTLIATWTTLAMSPLSVTAEYIFIAQVYKVLPQLRRASTVDAEAAGSTEPAGHAAQHSCSTVISGLKTTAYCTLLISSLPYYIRHSAFLESFSLSLLYLTVLSFSGQMITYLISVVWAERGEDWCTASRCRGCCLGGFPLYVRSRPSNGPARTSFKSSSSCEDCMMVDFKLSCGQRSNRGECANNIAWGSKVVRFGN